MVRVQPDLLPVVRAQSLLLVPDAGRHRHAPEGVDQRGMPQGGHLGADNAEVATLRHAARVHDLGRVAVPTRIWHKQERLSADDWEQVRLHAYHSERVLSRSPFLSALTPVATFHHERLD